jgi:hypothetical protein
VENENSFHAYLVEGGKEILPQILVAYENETGVATQGNPDVCVFDVSTFTIDNAREIKILATEAPLGGQHKLIIISAPFFAVEAQHALLKTLEEPFTHARFVLLTRQSGALLPTLRSRLVRKDYVTTSGVANAYAKEFLSLQSGARLELVARMLKKKDDVELGVLKEEVLGFIDTLEQKLRTALLESRETTTLAKALGEVVLVRSYLFDRSPSLKMLLEHLALVLPIL